MTKKVLTTETLVNSREFKTDEELFEAFKNGGKFWHVYTYDSKVHGISEMEVLCVSINKSHPNGINDGLPIVYTIEEDVDTKKKTRPTKNFISEMQNTWGKGVFSTKKGAEDYFAFAEQVFSVDEDWQLEWHNNATISEIESWSDDDRYFYDEE